MIPGVPEMHAGGDAYAHHPFFGSAPDGHAVTQTPTTPEPVLFNDAAQIILQEFTEAGLEEHANYAISVAQIESGLGTNNAPHSDPSELGQPGTSQGLFQLRTPGMLDDFYAAGYTNPQDNAQQARFVANYIRQSGPAGWMQKWSAALELAQGGTPPPGMSQSEANSILEQFGRTPGVGSSSTGPSSSQRDRDLNIQQQIADAQQAYWEGSISNGEASNLIQQNLGLLAEQRQSLELRLQNAREEERNAINQQLADNDSQRVLLEQLRDQVNSQIALRGQDVNIFGIQVQQRGQDVDAQTAANQQQIQIWQQKLADALSRGELQLAQEAQNQLTQLTEQQNLLTGRGQDVTQRGQDIDAQIAQNQQQLDDLRSQRDFWVARQDAAQKQAVEARIRAVEQQNVVLNAQKSQLEAATFEQTGVQGAGNIFSNLARDLGNIEFQRDSRLADMLANPRDFGQLQVALGNGTDFFQQLLNGQSPTGQSIGNAYEGGIPLLGDTFNQVLQEFQSRPELDFFTRAGELANQLAAMQAPETMSTEDMLAMFNSSLPDQQPLPELPGSFNPTPVNAPPVAPFNPAPIAPVSTGMPLPGEQQYIQDVVNPAIDAYDPYTAGPGTDLNSILDKILGNPYTPGGSLSSPQLTPPPPPVVNPVAPSNLPSSVNPNIPSPAPTPGTGLGPEGQTMYNSLVTQGMTPDAALNQVKLILQGAQQPPTYAEGGDVMIDHPTVAIDMVTGEPKFTMGEPTPEFPMGIPETAKITPITKMAEGGTAMTETRAQRMQREAFERVGYNAQGKPQAGVRDDSGRRVSASSAPSGGPTKATAPAPAIGKPPIGGIGTYTMTPPRLDIAQPRGPAPDRGPIGSITPVTAPRNPVSIQPMPTGGRPVTPRDMIGIVGDSPYLDPNRPMPIAGPTAPRPPSSPLPTFPIPPWFKPGPIDPIDRYNIGLPAPQQPANPEQAISQWLQQNPNGGLQRLVAAQQKLQQLLPMMRTTPGFNPAQLLYQILVGGTQSPDIRDIVGALHNFAPRMDEGGTAVTAPRNPAEILFGLRQNLTPRGFANLLPSQVDFLSSQVSALGMEPTDFYADLVRGFPRGLDPSAIQRASF